MKCSYRHDGGKKNYQPIVSFLAETREFVAGATGGRPAGKQIAQHLEEVFQTLPRRVVPILARADSGFCCWEALEAYEKFKYRFIVVACRTSRLPDAPGAAEWEPSPRTDADEPCEFWFQPKGWGKPRDSLRRVPGMTKEPPTCRALSAVRDRAVQVTDYWSRPWTRRSTGWFGFTVSGPGRRI